MTAALELIIAPDVAWRCAEKNLRLNEEARRAALLYAATKTGEHLPWLAVDNRMAVVTSLMSEHVPGVDFAYLSSQSRKATAR